MATNIDELPLAHLLLDCLRGAVTGTHPNPPLHFSLRIGEEIAQDLSQYDDLCCEGLAYVKIMNTYPSDNFPEPNDTYTPCGANQWAVDLELGVLRCAPVGTIDYVPTDADWTAAVEQVAHDQAALRQAVACFRDQLEPGTPWIPRAGTSISPQGGCTGSTQVVTVGFIHQLC